MPGRCMRGPGGCGGGTSFVGIGRCAIAGTGCGGVAGVTPSIASFGNAPVAGAGRAGISSTKVEPPCAEPIEALRKLTFCNTN